MEYTYLGRLRWTKIIVLRISLKISLGSYWWTCGSGVVAVEGMSHKDINECSTLAYYWSKMWGQRLKWLNLIHFQVCHGFACRQKSRQRPEVGNINWKLVELFIACPYFWGCTRYRNISRLWGFIMVRFVLSWLGSSGLQRSSCTPILWTH